MFLARTVGDLKSFQAEALFQDFAQPFSEKVFDTLGCASKKQLKTAAKLIQMLLVRMSDGAKLPDVLAVLTKRASIPSRLAMTILQLSLSASFELGLPNLELDLRNVLAFLTDISLKNKLEDALRKANREDGVVFSQSDLYELSNSNDLFLKNVPKLGFFGEASAQE